MKATPRIMKVQPPIFGFFQERIRMMSRTIEGIRCMIMARNEGSPLKTSRAKSAMNAM